MRVHVCTCVGWSRGWEWDKKKILRHSKVSSQVQFPAKNEVMEGKVLMFSDLEEPKKSTLAILAKDQWWLAWDGLSWGYRTAARRGLPGRNSVITQMGNSEAQSAQEAGFLIPVSSNRTNWIQTTTPIPTTKHLFCTSVMLLYQNISHKIVVGSLLRFEIFGVVGGNDWI